MTVPDMAGAVTITTPPVANTVTAPYPGTGANENARTFSQDEVNDLLNRARQQEKDKLYGRFETQGNEISELREQLTTFKSERDAIEQARLEAEAAAKAAEEKAAKDKAEAEMTAKQYADSRSEELLAQLEAMRAERELERATFAKEREFNELMGYRTQRMNEAADDIAPELLDLVTGNSREEIDASVALLTDRTAQIVESARAAQQGMTPPRPVSPTGRPNTDPFGGDATKTYSVEDLKNMSLADYAAIRTQLIGAASAQYRQGLSSR